MTRVYEGMFLIDNDAVRAGWAGAKTHVTDLLAKHGGEVHTARRWDERRLAYPIRHKNRATYMLAYFGIGGDGMDAFRRDLDISESVLRYLITGVEAVPEGEADKAAEENAADFQVPEPPADDAIDEPEPEEEPEAEAKEGEKAEDGEKKAEGDEAKADGEKPAEAPAETETKAEAATAAAGETKSEEA